MTKSEKVRSVLEILDFKRRNQYLLKLVLPEVAKMLKDTPDALGTRELMVIQQSIIRAMDQTYDTLLGELEAIYMKIYTDEEIEEMYRWYNSPLGKSIQQKSANEVLASVHSTTHNWMMRITKIALDIANRDLGKSNIGIA